jgi:hypothetical protein
MLLPNLNQFCAMRRDGEFEFAGEFAEVLLPPEIADEKFAGEFEVGPVGGDGGVGFAEVKEADGFRAVFEVFGIDVEVAVF